MNKKGNFKKFMLLWAGELISCIGGGLTSFGLGVYIFNQTGNATGMALVTLLGFLPTLLLSVPAGVLADRYDRRLLMMIGDGCSALGVLYILLCMLNGEAALWQICIGVTVSSVFSSLLEPSYRATVTDLLTREEYSKATGLVALAGNARYLVSPLLAGFMLAVWDVKVLLVIDIATFFLTVAATLVVKRGIATKAGEQKESFKESLAFGWKTITGKRGIIVLIAVVSVMTLFMGMFQLLAEPMLLSFTDAKTLGTAETICACGMLVSGLYLGIRGIKKNFVNTICISLALAGICMAGFGWRENVTIMVIFGFLFFLMLPICNNCLDYLVRTNIPDEAQGRAWGFIGLISNFGYVFAYGFSGILADTIADMRGISVGRGAAVLVVLAGIAFTLLAVFLFFLKSVRALEKGDVTK